MEKPRHSIALLIIFGLVTITGALHIAAAQETTSTAPALSVVTLDITGMT